MPAIGIDQDRILVYEGRTFGYGHAVWPTPVVTIATLLRSDQDIGSIPSTDALTTKLVFREDSFDPVTRVKRGRLYHWQDQQAMPSPWRVQPHPAYERDKLVAANNNGWVDRTLFAFHAWPAMRELGRGNPRATIALGTKDAYTVWRILTLERIATGEDLLTLRSRGMLGLLPDLSVESIPADGRTGVIDAIGKLSDAAHRAAAESIVDLARGAAQWCLGVWLANRFGKPELKTLDLGHLAKMLGDTAEKDIAALVARFHSRAKPNERERYGLRPVSEEDGEFAIASIGLLLRELGWAQT